LENLLGSPCIKRRIRRRAIRDHQMGDHQNPPCSFNAAPESYGWEPYSKFQDLRFYIHINRGMENRIHRIAKIGIGLYILTILSFVSIFVIQKSEPIK
jgi:hypothetical protein